MYVLHRRFLYHGQSNLIAVNPAFTGVDPGYRVGVSTEISGQIFLMQASW